MFLTYSYLYLLNISLRLKCFDWIWRIKKTPTVEPAYSDLERYYYYFLNKNKFGNHGAATVSFTNRSGFTWQSSLTPRSTGCKRLTVCVNREKRVKWNTTTTTTKLCMSSPPVSPWNSSSSSSGCHFSFLFNLRVIFWVDLTLDIPYMA